MTDGHSGAGGRDSPPNPWDLVVRLTHWGIAGVVLANAALTDGGSVAHVWAGWLGLGLLLLRAIWGVTGPAEARFSAFPPRPRAGLAHLAALFRGTPPRYPSHNPAGALMVWALWGLLAFMMASGLALTGTGPLGWADRQAAAAAGDWAAIAADPPPLPRDVQKLVKEAHEVAGNLIVILSLVHVAGVAVEGRRLRRNLVRPMLFGDRR
jgi:cytochrome b